MSRLTVFDPASIAEYVQSDDHFSVPFEGLWQACGYSRKSNALRQLKNELLEGEDFCSEVSKSNGGRDSNDYWLTSDAAKIFAVRARTDQGVVIARLFVAAFNELKQRLLSPQPKLQHLYLARFKLFTAHTHIPLDYFCIFEEILGMMSKLEIQGYHFPDNACPDISIGRCWNIWLRSEGWDTDQFPYYDHHYPDQRGIQPAKIYPIDPLGSIFKPWLFQTYMQKQLPEYVKKLSGVEDQILVRQIVSATVEQFRLNQA